MTPQPRTPGSNASLLLRSAWTLAGISCALLLSIAPLAAQEVAARANPLPSLVLRSEVQVARSVVRLADVVDTTDLPEATHRALARLALAPAPAIGKRIRLSKHEIQELVSLSLDSERRVRVRGPEWVTVVRGEQDTANDTEVDRVTLSLQQAIGALVAQKFPKHTQFSCDLLTPAIPREHRSDFKLQRVTGGEPPWQGRQRFFISYESSGLAHSLPLWADIQVTAPTVVLTRAIARGETIHQADLAFVAVDPAASGNQGVSRLEDVVGKQASRSLRAGDAVKPGDVERPVWVKRRSAVVIHSVAAGVRITTQGMALDEGREGELIRVQNVQSEEAFMAQVTGPSEVTVFAGPRIASTHPEADQ